MSMFIVINETTKIQGTSVLGHVASRHRTVLAAIKADKSMQPRGNSYVPTTIAREADGISLKVGEYVNDTEVVEVDRDEIQDAYYML